MPASTAVHQVLAGVCDHFINPEPADIITFATRKYFLGLDLWPTQRAILQAFYGMEPDGATRPILERWARAGRTNWQQGTEYKELCIVAGMRSSKTFLASVICAYEIYLNWLMLPGDRRKHYGLAPGAPLHGIVVATSEKQAQQTIYGNLAARIRNSPYFSTVMDLATDLRATAMAFPDGFEVLAGACTSASLVGKTDLFVALDELARMIRTTGKAGATEVRVAVDAYDPDGYIDSATLMYRLPGDPWTEVAMDLTGSSANRTLDYPDPASIELTVRITDDAGNSVLWDVPGQSAREHVWHSEPGTVIHDPYGLEVGTVDVNGALTIQDYIVIPTGHTLTIEKGLTLRFAMNAGILVTGGAALVAKGTDAQPITFQSGALFTWDGIRFEEGTGILDHVVIDRTRHGVYMDRASPTITNSTISDCTGFAVTCYDGASPLLEHNSIVNCADGILLFHPEVIDPFILDPQPPAPTISHNSIKVNSGGVAVHNGSGMEWANDTTTLGYLDDNYAPGTVMTVYYADFDGDTTTEITDPADPTVGPRTGGPNPFYRDVSMVTNFPPVADQGDDVMAVVGERVFFNGTYSYDTDGTITQWEWDFGDGASDINMTSNHTYTAPGEYTVVLTVTDNDGGTDIDLGRVTVMTVEDAMEYFNETLYSLDEEDFSNPRKAADRKDSLSDDLQDILELIDEGQYQTALDRLRDKIGGKVAGWISDPAVQEQFNNLIRSIIFSDTDLDGLGFADEVENHTTDPLDPDTDGDTMHDGWEVGYGLNATNDNDGIQYLIMGA